MYDTVVHISAHIFAANIDARKDQAAQSSCIAFSVCLRVLQIVWSQASEGGRFFDHDSIQRTR
jgi:hypothetical protein